MLYKFHVASRPLAISDARKRLSALVERVARGGAPVTIGRYGAERAVLVGADEYARLRHGLEREAPAVPSLAGSLKLTCSPAELAEESRRLGALWLTALDQSPTRARRRRRSS